FHVTGVQTCALPISAAAGSTAAGSTADRLPGFSCDLAVNLAALGSVGTQTARIWLRSPHVCPLRLRLEWQGQRREYELDSERLRSEERRVGKEGRVW